MSGCMLFCYKVTFRGDMPLHSFTWVMMLLLIIDYYSLWRRWIYSLCGRPAVLLHHFVLNGGVVDLEGEFSWCITLVTSLLALQATLYVTAAASSWRWQATLSLWWQVDVDVRPHYHCGGKLMEMSGHIITVVANWCRCQATLSLWWQSDVDVRPHYHCGGKLMEMSCHIITIVAVS